jgi:hypothetical protein
MAEEVPAKKSREMTSNWRLEEDEISCRFYSLTENSHSRREPYVANTHNAKITIDDVSGTGTILFDGYWYTEEYFEKWRYEAEPWTEIVDPPQIFQLHYTKYSKDFTSTYTRKWIDPILRFRSEAEGHADTELKAVASAAEAQATKEETMYTYPMLEEIVAEIEIYERQAVEDTSGEGEYDDELGGRIIFFPTQKNLLKFKVLKRIV